MPVEYHVGITIHLVYAYEAMGGMFLEGSVHPLLK